VVLGNPEPEISGFVRGLGDIERSAEGVGARIPVTNRSEIQDGQGYSIHA
jgi:hypothetical protein